MSLLEIRDLTKTIGRRKIVDRLSLDVQQGEIVGLVGPNGAGKTTTIRMMVGLISKSGGHVHINGEDVSKNFEASMKHVGVMVENADMYSYLSGYNNLIHFARMSVGATLERIDEVIALVDLEDSIHKRVATYSLGMKQRLGLAIALVHKPSLLVLDEPTNGLDPNGIRQLREHLINLAKHQGTGVLISSHLMSEMELMCDRIAVLQKGKLLGVQRVSELIGEGVAQVQIEVDRTDLAIPILQVLLAGKEITADHNTLQVSVNKEQIPQISQSLMKAGVNVYGIQMIKKSLEDKFIEITEGSHSD
ncbi:ABC transporter ATP-binding protein [Paenibacillus sp. SYP-B3998]|uniref:ABC transporter ATP-binding protein n=1 Tax=Paenibacillus sp. SYP-B3998 TaxID=2678564 RepID=A0A6G4A0A3_9BACL|nr:ABC transporter ATP-binding protein [Paenibacillus sp. SYP-B3998]NEW07893.1 ABC transporter ATP-binding protein [Paenibacillus sp. SYP-B3998]